MAAVTNESALSKLNSTKVERTGARSGSRSTDRSEEKTRVAWNSILLTLLLISAKLFVGWLTNSLAIISQAAESGFDLVALLVTLLAVRVSAIPPDEDHLYGHGKFENLSALVQAVLLLIITGLIAAEAIDRLGGREIHPVHVNIWSFLVLLGSMTIDLGRTRMLKKAGKKHNSQALEATALHFMTDLFSGGVVIIGLLLVEFAHWQNADAWAAVFVSVFVAFLSIRLGKEAIDGLTDRYSDSKEYRELRLAIEATPAIEAVRSLRIRQAGPYYFIEVSVEVNRTLPYAAIQRILKDVEDRIQASFEESDITVRWYPVRTYRESPFETLKLVASEYGLAPHNVELTQTEAGEVFLDYHLEFPPSLDLRHANDLGRKVEEEVRSQLPQVSKVIVHLEEERSDRVPATVRDTTPDHIEMVHGIEQVAKKATSGVLDVKEIQITEQIADGRMKLVLTIVVDSHISLAEGHDVSTAVESAIRQAYPTIARVVTHVRPTPF